MEMLECQNTLTMTAPNSPALTIKIVRWPELLKLFPSSPDSPTAAALQWRPQRLDACPSSDLVGVCRDIEEVHEESPRVKGAFLNHE